MSKFLGVVLNLEKQVLIDALIEFQLAHSHVVMALHDLNGIDLPDGIFDNYPFDKPFDELMIADWTNEAIRKLRQSQAKERQKLFLKIIEMLENRYWEYQIVGDRIQVDIGNECWDVSKYDFVELKDLHDEIANW